MHCRFIVAKVTGLIYGKQGFVETFSYLWLLLLFLTRWPSISHKSEGWSSVCLALSKVIFYQDLFQGNALNLCLTRYQMDLRGFFPFFYWRSIRYIFLNLQLLFKNRSMALYVCVCVFVEVCSLEEEVVTFSLKFPFLNQKKKVVTPSYHDDDDAFITQAKFSSSSNIHCSFRLFPCCHP